MEKTNGSKRNQGYKHYARILSKQKKMLKDEYSVREIGIFGSFVRGEQKMRSDLDILVEFEKVPGLLKFIELEMLLGKMLKRKVDLVRKQAIRPELKEHILGEVVYL